jgi:hypothetical protein
MTTLVFEQLTVLSDAPRKLRRWTISLVVATSLTGCAPMPFATNPQISTQSKIRSVSHWQILAKDIAASVPSDLIARQKVLYVKAGATGSPFDQAFETSLAWALTRQCQKSSGSASCLIKQGHRVLEKGKFFTDSEPYLAYGIVKVHHHDRGSGAAPMGTFTLLGAGIWLGHKASSSWSATSRYAAAPATGALIDLLSGMVAGPTHTEVIVSIAVVGSDGGIAFRNDQSYYVDDADSNEYPNEPLYTPLGLPPTTTPIPADDVIKIKDPPPTQARTDSQTGKRQP